MAVYLMHDKATGYYKIGRSQNPQYREATLLGQAPEVWLWSYWDCPDYRERWLHTTFASCRGRGEWFKLLDKDVLRLYAIMVHRRIDVHLPIEWGPGVLNATFQHARRVGEQNRYDRVDFWKPAIIKRIVPSEMEWHQDGQVIDSPLYSRVDQFDVARWSTPKTPTLAKRIDAMDVQERKKTFAALKAEFEWCCGMEKGQCICAKAVTMYG